MDDLKLNLNLERRFFYNLLSDIFIVKPDINFLEKINNKDVYFFLKNFIGSLENIKILENHVNVLLNDNQKLLELNSTFENLFVIPVAAYYIPPFMSAFVNYVELRSGNAFYTLGEELKSFYAMHSLNFKYRSDHLSTIFSFMAYLIDIELTYKETNTFDEQSRFFLKYIATWADKFFNEVIERSNEEFYKIFALIGKNYIIKENGLFVS